MEDFQLEKLLKDFQTKKQITENMILTTQKLFSKISIPNLKKQIIFNNKNINPTIINLLLSNDNYNYDFLLKFIELEKFIKKNDGYTPNKNNIIPEHKKWSSFINNVKFNKNKNKIERNVFLLKYIKENTKNISKLEEEKRFKYQDTFERFKVFVLNNNGAIPSIYIKEYKDIGEFYKKIKIQQKKNIPPKDEWYEIKRKEILDFINKNVSGLSYNDQKNKITFEKNFLLLKEFINNNEGFLPSETKHNIEEKKLSIWVRRILLPNSEEKYRNILKQYIKNIKANNHLAYKRTFEKNFLLLKNFIENNNGYLPSTDIKNIEECKLGSWLNLYYDKNKILNENTDIRILKVTEYITLHTKNKTKAADNIKNTFEVNFQKLKNFVENNNKCLPKHSKTDLNENELNLWLISNYYKKLNGKNIYLMILFLIMIII